MRMPEHEPMTKRRCFFRYLKAEYALQALQQEKWKVGRFAELNDPLDCKPVLTHSNGVASDQAHPFFERFANEYGIICISEVINDPVVWSHYAESHRGIALGFEFPPHELHEVTYDLECNQRASVHLEHLYEVEKKEASLVDVISLGYARKARSWAYEKEFRYFLPLNTCLMSGVHYFLRLPLEHLKFVVLGVRCQVNASDIYRILNSCTALMKPHSIKVLKAGMDETSYDLRIEAVEELPKWE